MSPRHKCKKFYHLRTLSLFTIHVKLLALAPNNNKDPKVNKLSVKKIICHVQIKCDPKDEKQKCIWALEFKIDICIRYFFIKAGAPKESKQCIMYGWCTYNS